MPHMRPTSSSRRTAAIAALCLSLLLGLAGGAARAHAHPADRPGTPPPQYAAARDAVVRDGRAAARLIAAGEAARLHARFTPQLAAQVPLDRLEALLRDTRAAAPVGAREGESALPLAPTRRIYIADHAWDGRTLGFTVAFDARARIGSLLVAPREPLAADPAAGAPAAVLRMPVDGTWWTFWGGPAQRQNHHVQVPDQRHALDLVQWRDGGTARGDGAANADYHAWRKPVTAPAPGVVVEARDGVRDNRPQVEVENRDDPAGNHVILDVDGGRHVLLAHLARGTVAVRAGDRVRAGAFLGRVGNSGNASEPHLHIHVQDAPRLFTGTGQPLAFRDVVVDGRARDRAELVQGQFAAGR
jgi:murein DD-endopeptidase MepM/ murein hydrolase activator NlpD